MMIGLNDAKAFEEIRVSKLPELNDVTAETLHSTVRDVVRTCCHCLGARFILESVTPSLNTDATEMLRERKAVPGDVVPWTSVSGWVYRVVVKDGVTDPSAASALLDAVYASSCTTLTSLFNATKPFLYPLGVGASIGAACGFPSHDPRNAKEATAFLKEIAMRHAADLQAAGAHACVFREAMQCPGGVLPPFNLRDHLYLASDVDLPLSFTWCNDPCAQDGDDRESVSFGVNDVVVDIPMLPQGDCFWDKLGGLFSKKMGHITLCHQALVKWQPLVTEAVAAGRLRLQYGPRHIALCLKVHQQIRFRRFGIMPTFGSEEDDKDGGQLSGSVTTVQHIRETTQAIFVQSNSLYVSPYSSAGAVLTCEYPLFAAGKLVVYAAPHIGFGSDEHLEFLTGAASGKPLSSELTAPPALIMTLTPREFTFPRGATIVRRVFPKETASELTLYSDDAVHRAVYGGNAYVYVWDLDALRCAGRGVDAGADAWTRSVSVVVDDGTAATDTEPLAADTDVDLHVEPPPVDASVEDLITWARTNTQKPSRGHGTVMLMPPDALKECWAYDVNISFLDAVDGCSGADAGCVDEDTRRAKPPPCKLCAIAVHTTAVAQRDWPYQSVAPAAKACVLGTPPHPVGLTIVP